MEILYKDSEKPQNVALVLGFFDGLHLGHLSVIKNVPANTPVVVVTFSESPSEYFGKKIKYIYSRQKNYELLNQHGISFIYEQDFSKIANLSAEEYLSYLIKEFNPISITSGFNHTFGAKRVGNPDFLRKNEVSYKYFYTEPTIIDNEIVSSTKIKTLIENAELKKAKDFLSRNFSITSSVVEGEKLGRQLGFPTANMKYPKGIVKLPYGVYKVKVLGHNAVMNWGIKPTFRSEEVIEVHIPNFEDDLYGKTLEVEIISKIRDEQKFEDLIELKTQIKKDVEECLK